MNEGLRRMDGVDLREKKNRARWVTMGGMDEVGELGTGKIITLMA